MGRAETEPRRGRFRRHAGIPDPAVLARIAGEVMHHLLQQRVGRPEWRPDRLVRRSDQCRKPGTDRHPADAVGQRDRAKMGDHKLLPDMLGQVTVVDGQAVRHRQHDRGDTAADAERGNRCVDRRARSVTDPAADIAQNALGGGGYHLAGAGIGVVDEFVDHDAAVGTHIQRRLIGKQDLRRSHCRRDDAFLMNDVAAHRQCLRGASRRSAGGVQIDGADFSVVLRIGADDRRHRRKQQREQS